MTNTLTPKEPLSDSAPLARRLAGTHCPDACREYHGLWQYFRLIGLIGTLGDDGVFLVETLRRLVDPEHGRRILISAAADYGMLAHLLHACRLAGVDPEVTVIDLCETPLALNRWYAERLGVAIRTLRVDVADFRDERPFDLICTHSFLGRLDPATRVRALGAWYEALRPGGRVVTVARVRHGAPDSDIRFTAPEVAAFRARAFDLAGVWEGRLDMDREVLADAAERYALAKRSRGFGSPEALRACFEGGGFELELFATGGEAERRRDRPSGPSLGWRSERYRIVAVKR